MPCLWPQLQRAGVGMLEYAWQTVVGSIYPLAIFYVSFNLSVYLSICQSIRLSIFPSVYMSGCLSA